MKILYATQATGNGHLSRALEIIPYLQNLGQTEVLVSGHAAQLQLPFEILKQLHGVSFIFGQKGGVDLSATLKKFKPVRLIKDIAGLQILHYDLIINDFEPVTAWAAHLKGVPLSALSHQYSFTSHAAPRPEKKSRFAEWIFRHYAPANKGIGFHFQPYEPWIQTPVIKQKIRQQVITNSPHITVYLPAWNDEVLARHFKRFRNYRFELFSRKVKSIIRDSNVWMIPLQEDVFIESMAGSTGVITGGGFETPAEALFMGKKLMSIPMLNQYEQQCNAIALKKMGVTVVPEINEHFGNRLGSWLEYHQPIKVDFPDQTKATIQQMLSFKKTNENIQKPIQILLNNS